MIGNKFTFGDNKFEVFQTLMIAYIAVWVTSPVMAYGTSFRIIALVCMLTWLFLEISHANGIVRRLNYRALLITVFCLYTIIVNVMIGEQENIISSIQLYVFFFFIIVADSYKRKGLHKLDFVLYVLLFTMPVWYLTTIIGLNENSRAARIAIRSASEAYELTKSGVGGFSLVYFSVAYTALLLAALKYFFSLKKNRLVLNFLLILNASLAVLVIVKAQYSTALILLCFVVFMFFSIKNKINHFSIIVMMLAMVSMVAIYFNLSDILDVASIVLDGSNYQMKIQDLQLSLSGSSGETVNDRIIRYKRSLVLFFENPIFGTLSRRDIGKHSLLLDTYAQFGILMGCMFTYITMSIPFNLFRKLTGKISLSLPMLIVIFALISLNNISMSYGLVCYVLYLIVVDKVERVNE